MTIVTIKRIGAICLIAATAMASSTIEAGEKTRSIGHWVDSLFFRAEDQESDDPAQWCHPDSATLTIDTAGLLGGHPVIEVIYHCSDSEWCDDGKALLFETSGQDFELLYIYINDCSEVHLQPSRIIVVDSTEILLTRSQSTGTGGLVEEKYWGWSDSAGGPIDLKQNRVTSEALSQVLPEGYYVAWGGFFNIETLSLGCYVRRPGDHNCCPTGGWVALRYDIDGSALRVISCDYDPDRIDTGSD